MTFEYPSNYYALRRIVGHKISEKLQSLQDGQFVDREELVLDLKIFARELSLESGLSLKSIHEMFEQRGVMLREVMPHANA